MEKKMTADEFTAIADAIVSYWELVEEKLNDSTLRDHRRKAAWRKREFEFLFHDCEYIAKAKEAILAEFDRMEIEDDVDLAWANNSALNLRQIRPFSQWELAVAEAGFDPQEVLR